jgi:glycine hydroxymethyltransferase
VTGGTDNHLMLVDVSPLGLTGRQAAGALVECGVTLNKNAIPFDRESPLTTSGLRLGTPAVTTLGMGAAERKEIAGVIRSVLKATKAGVVESGDKAGQPSKVKYALEPGAKTQACARVKTLLARYPVYPSLDLAFLQKHFAS